MKVRFSLYEKEDQKESLKVLKETWGEEFLRNKQALQRGIIKALALFESQLTIVLERERIEGEIGFDIWMLETKSKEELWIKPYLLPRYVGHIPFKNLGLWFDLGDSFFVEFLVINDFFHDEDETLAIEAIEHFAYDNAWIISSDVAREGIPKKMKQIIGDIKRGLSHIDPYISFD